MAIGVEQLVHGGLIVLFYFCVLFPFLTGLMNSWSSLTFAFPTMSWHYSI